jgi:hypothetical protein
VSARPFVIRNSGLNPFAAMGKNPHKGKAGKCSLATIRPRPGIREDEKEGMMSPPSTFAAVS